MNDSSFTCFTPELRRLSTFLHIPLPNHQKLSISNSPAKLAKAGFQRRENAASDEVDCEYCGIVYSEWAGESPFAVHRVLNEHCVFLNTPSSANIIRNHPRVVEVRRRLFPYNDDATGNEVDDADSEVGDDANDETTDEERDSEAEGGDSESANGSIDGESNDSQQLEQVVPPAFVSVLSPQADYTFPFQPRVGDNSMLFASRRLMTFSEPGCPECVEWAEEGFLFRADTRDVQCVFCAVVLPMHTCEPKDSHAKESPFCPLVLLIDVGNISAAEEERIKLKNLQRQLKNKSQQRSYAICYPQYEDESVRTGTFENWPHKSWDDNLHVSVMSEAGFYFTGCADKVKCYSCGVGLYQWRQGSDPWVQHALHMPTCPHLQAKGQHFIQQAAEAQALTEADLPSTANSSPAGSPSTTGQLVTSPPGSLTLDICAVTAALATSRYPTKDILLGTLRAADENFAALRQQREELWLKDTELQQTHTELQQTHTELQQTHTELQQTHTELQQTHTELQQHVGIVEQQNQVIQQHREELQQQEEALRSQEEELERRRRQKRYQDQQIESLRMQVQALMADRQEAGLQAEPLRAAVQPVPQDGDGDASMMRNMRCKVCLSEESNTIFRPCHHISCCSHCAHRLDNARCPVCRAPINDVLPVYIA